MDLNVHTKDYENEFECSSIEKQPLEDADSLTQSLDSNSKSRTKRAKIMFTKDEDKKLIRAVRKFGEHDWKLISSFLENRTGRQCRERWKKFLCPSLNHSPWTKEEDEILLSKYREFGPKWSQISCYFENRTDVNIKTRFTVLARKMKKEQEFVNQAKIFPFQKFFPVANFSSFMFCSDLNANYIKNNKKFVKKLKNFVNCSSNNIAPKQEKADIVCNNDTRNICSTNFIESTNEKNKFGDNLLDVIFSPIQQTIEEDFWDDFNNIIFN